MNMTSQPPPGDGMMMPPADTRRARTEPRGGGGPSASATDWDAMTCTPPGRASRTVSTTRFCAPGRVSRAARRAALQPARAGSNRRTRYAGRRGRRAPAAKQ